MSDYETMPAGRRMDALVAEKVMGLQPCVFHQAGSISGMMTMWRCSHPGSSSCFPSNIEAQEHSHSVLHRYSTDIKSAWDVAQKLIGESAYFDIGKHSLQWGATFNGITARADTASLAICRAALRVVSQ